MPSQNPVLIICLGNRFRSDDGVGLYIADTIRSYGNELVEVVDNISDSAALMDTWSNKDRVFIVDAVNSNGKPGAIYRFDVSNKNIPADIFARYSTHSINLAEAIEMAKILARMPKSLVVFGIEGADFEAGTGLAPEVEKAASAVIATLLREVEEYAAL
jgi:hydrogenase maturation protease